MLVKVFPLENENEAVTTFSLGSHVIGRGPILKCNDKRVSRNHATLEVTADSVKLTSLHINPCFLKAANSKTLTVLSRSESSQLKDGDAFAFLPEDYWFRIKIDNEDAPGNEVGKRQIETIEEDPPPSKKTKTDETNEESDETKNTVEETSTSHTENIEGATEANPDDNKNEEKRVVKEVDDGAQQNEITSSQDVKKEVQDVPNDGTTPSTSNSRPRRERCWYGAECYRKNPTHHQDFTHPGDSDFESDPEDNRPSCSYGGACYRRNIDHRRNYKHPPGKPPSKKKRNRKKVKRPNIADSEELKELDLSDSEDPFIVDDDSDEYEGDSDEEDSDWDDSQELEEDSENLKGLLKEAKKFTKK